MELEIRMDLSEVDEKDIPEIEKRFLAWYEEGAEVRYDKPCFGSYSRLEQPFNYRVDLGPVDCIPAIRDLHGRLYRFGVKVFVHFLY